ncbi:MAG: phospho-sugar mutase [Eggerthellaceae bacterium]|nr:phospho-sugar mutase [Eggerthellaceae bacterium]
MNTQETAQLWLENVADDELHAQLEELLASENKDALEDAFFQNLSFGTAGLRGIIGPGTNRMNIYTVGRATQGLANYILDNCPDEVPRVAIARDSRHKGEEFVAHAASVLAANGIEVHIYPRIEPTPALSFAVRELDCFAGICMTASHNPASYNGYKAYGADGCQITSEAAKAISFAIEGIDTFSDVKTMPFDDACARGLVKWIDDAVLDSFIEHVLACSVRGTTQDEFNLKLVYTPLCGTGLECMERIFDALGISSVSLVEEQSKPDGNFPTCEYPNPEERAALELGLELARQIDADLLIATDPDADRVGIAVNHEAHFELLTGNEVGILMFDYLCRRRIEQGSMPLNPIAVSTIVSTAMIDAIAREYNVEVKRTLTGFKYIGDIITQLEQSGEEERFILGFEESYGYLTGTHVRDKDAINASLIICEMADYYKNAGQSLVDVLKGLYERYGFYANRTINVAFPGERGLNEMRRIMDGLRSAAPARIGGYSVEATRDYQPGVDGLPPADVVELSLAGGNKLIFRPSGTEPKIKVYLFCVCNNREDVQVTLDSLEEAARSLLG